ncbi:hypothetical protein JK358_38295 [Nocardia sp. 2]|uniref:Uncharacterized protein n=1 Tax=Nocardia acididurans TaxID=2802282 RepID=A0ABS1MHY1_9NOCA|nr:hypothetical protein [Nocardia acididurans]MBL1080263.1 hypothetical protein [Nocardia acididurans]
MARKARYTPEEIAQWRAEEQARAAHVDALLSDPDAVSGLVSSAVRIRCARFLGYSLRNQALILRQAEERGFPVTEVDTASGWRARGRYPDQPGLRIARPKGRETAGQDEGESAPEAVIYETSDSGESTGEGESRTRFRTSKVWDISQTKGIEDFEGEPVTVEPVTDPAAALWETLCKEAGRYGFTVATSADAGGPSVDEGQAVITVAESQRIDHLARVLGPMSTDRARAAHAATERPPREYSGRPVDLGEFGTAYLCERTDLEAARSYYTISGKRLSGTLTVWIEANPLEPTESVHTLRIAYGEDDGRRDRMWWERPNRPQVNGIEVVGASGRIRTAVLPNLSTWEINNRRPVSRTHTEQCPPRTSQKVVALVGAILREFLARPDLEQIRRAAHVVADRNRRAELRKAAQQLADEIEQVRIRSAEHLESLAADRAVLLAQAADGEDLADRADAEGVAVAQSAGVADPAV